MDFQTHLYELGELEQHLQDIGFTSVTVYSSYEKVIAKNNHTEMFLYECSFLKKRGMDKDDSLNHRSFAYR